MFGGQLHERSNCWGTWICKYYEPFKLNFCEMFQPLPTCTRDGYFCRDFVFVRKEIEGKDKKVKCDFEIDWIEMSILGFQCLHSLKC